MDAKMFSGLIRVGIETHVVQILFFQGCRESCGDAKTYKYLEGQRGGSRRGGATIFASPHNNFLQVPSLNFFFLPSFSPFFCTYIKLPDISSTEYM